MVEKTVKPEITEPTTSMPTIVIDTREQLPYSFNAPCVRRKLPAGDYSVDGYDWEIAVERKSLEDYVKSVINDRVRFKKELLSLQEYKSACIVVEAPLASIKPGGYPSGANPNAVFGATTSIIVDYGIPIYFCSDRQVARKFTEEWLIRWHRKLQRKF